MTEKEEHFLLKHFKNRKELKSFHATFVVNKLARGAPFVNKISVDFRQSLICFSSLSKTLKVLIKIFWKVLVPTTMDPQPSESGRQLESGHPRADMREEVLKFLVHAVGGCRVCAPISGNNVEHVGEFLVRLHPNDQ